MLSPTLTGKEGHCTIKLQQIAFVVKMYSFNGICPVGDNTNGRQEVNEKEILA